MTSDNPSQRVQSLMQRAVLAQQRGDFATAEAGYREVLHAVPEHADATHFLGLLAHQTGHWQSALDLLHRSIRLGPGSPLYQCNLAGALREQGRPVEAEIHYREAISLKPGYVDALIGLAMSQAVRNRFEEALTNYREVLSIDKENFEAQMGCGASLFELTRYSEAMACYGEIHVLVAHDAEKLQRLGLALREAGEADEAKSCFMQALSLRPDFAEAHNSFGIALADLGEFSAAETHYREALRLRPKYIGAWHNLVNIRRIDQIDKAWPALEKLSREVAQFPPAEAAMLHFVLGKAHDDIGEFGNAFMHYLEGNKLKRATLDYDESRQQHFFSDFIRYFDSSFLASRADAGLDSELPIFIIGMSRSGTTLVEQILASHPQVHGAGEIHLLRRCLHLELGSVDNEDELPVRLAQMQDAGFRRIADRYCTILAQRAPEATRITDKLPGNMALIGLIHLAFPAARIIHCVRDPLDTCVSCFSKLFTTGHAFSYDLAELGRFHRLYQQLMMHWRTVLPEGRMLEVRYEEMIADTEAQSRRLLEFCGLPWDDACLRFNETRRAVKTASLAQVRQPIYTSSQGRWRHYQDYLGPLQRALADE